MVAGPLTENPNLVQWVKEQGLKILLSSRRVSMFIEKNRIHNFYGFRFDWSNHTVDQSNRNSQNYYIF